MTIEESIRKLEEKISIIVDTDKDSTLNTDLTFTLNTGIEAFATTTTNVINAELQCIILIASKPVNIKISFTDYPDVTLFEAEQFIGVDYFYIRKAAVGTNPTDVFEQVAAAWALNDSLRISVEGNLNTEVTVILRHR
ncbi:MAG: hypothetical protein IIC67_06410 [Thaumarchaeota archaeon]|nr:hypothetical protein [Nitrososphaerota archaeon]